MLGTKEQGEWSLSPKIIKSIDQRYLPGTLIVETTYTQHSGAVASVNDFMAVRDRRSCGPNLSDVGNRLTEQDMIVRILNGGRNMPAYASILHPDQLTDLVEYLKIRTTHAGPDITQTQ